MATEKDHSVGQSRPTIDVESLKQRIETVRKRLAEAAKQAGRRPDEITLIGVSKFFPPEMAMAANQLGLSDLGENRVQELLEKIDRLRDAGLNPNWHLIGTLQKNKVRQILGKTHLIHSVDSLGLLEEISRRSQNKGLVTDLLLQVNTARETSKHGFSADKLFPAAEQAIELPGVRLRGLMTMAPLYDDPEQARPVFEQTRSLFEQLRGMAGKDTPINILSMGMSVDFVQAIGCGATHVRIGTAIFGPRL